MLKKDDVKNINILKSIIKLQNIYFNTNVIFVFYVKYNINISFKDLV